jgi:hypothetical protein
VDTGPVGPANYLSRSVFGLSPSPPWSISLSFFLSSQSIGSTGCVQRSTSPHATSQQARCMWCCAWLDSLPPAYNWAGGYTRDKWVSPLIMPLQNGMALAIYRRYNFLAQVGREAGLVAGPSHPQSYLQMQCAGHPRAASAKKRGVFSVGEAAISSGYGVSSWRHPYAVLALFDRTLGHNLIKIVGDGWQDRTGGGAVEWEWLAMACVGVMGIPFRILIITIPGSAHMEVDQHKDSTS